jgi:N-acetylglucosaminyl-diphospho-decaprenol L-rhamnosyltransferase
MSDENEMRKDSRPKVSVIIVTYRSANEISDCLESLLRQRVPVEIFLVDNASPDNTPDVVTDYAARFENIHAILSKENVGLAAANNFPLGKCQGKYVLILNPDTLCRPDTLERMIDFLDSNPDVGVVGPKNVSADGTPHASFHRHWGILHVLIWRVMPYRVVRMLYDRFSSYERQDILFVSGACLMLRRSIFEQIGGYDPEYFLTVEDACDLCIRARETGCRVMLLPDSEVLHIGGRSAVNQVPYIVVWQGYRGTIYHFMKHKGMAQALVVSFLLIVGSAARAAIAAILGIKKKQYRDVARIYANVFWSLLVRNPMRAKAYDLAPQ